MIVFSAIVPHAPFLLPSVGKTATERLSATKNALELVEERLVLSKPDTLVIISPHAPRYPDAWSANMAPRFTAHMQEFGDHETAVPARVNYLLLDRIHRAMREEAIPFTLRSSESLDYGYTVPLACLAATLPNPSLIPLAPNEGSLEAQIAFGTSLYRILQREDARIAVIASADLSHLKTPDGTQEQPDAIIYDTQIREAVKRKQPDLLLKAAAALPNDSHPCGERPIAILLGLLSELNTTSEELCYEAPFGVGYLTVAFRIA